MADSNKIPCIELPKAKTLKIRLPFGGELSSVADISKGPPSDCTLVNSLMLQLMPTLGGLTCFLKVLNVIKKLEELKDVKGPQDLGKLPEIAEAAAEVAICFNAFAQIPFTIADILRIIIAYLKCIIEAINSILEFQVGIDLNSAQGNPVLLASLNCAQNNAQTSLDQLLEALTVIEPLLEIVKPIAEVAGVSLELPSLAEATDAEDITQTLQNLSNTLEQLQQTVDALDPTS